MSELKAFKLEFGPEGYIAWAPNASQAAKFTIQYRAHVKAGTRYDVLEEVAEAEANELGAKRPWKKDAKGKVYQVSSTKATQVWPF